LPDLRADAKVYEWAGVGFDEFEVHNLQKSLQKHIAACGASEMRLWGKIRGSEKDYYVAEGKLDAPGDAESGDLEEGRGTGVNKMVYWVTNGPMHGWTQLPDLQPQDIINARSIKMAFTGNLDHKIYTNPFYFGTEKLYLRAQIARISHSTTLAPAGQHRTNEENPREVEDATLPEGDEPVPKPLVKDMATADAWVHHSLSILKQGRTTHRDGKPLEGEDDVDPDELLRREVTKDPWEERLKPITKDNKTQGSLPAWVLRSHNVKDTYLDVKKNQHNFGVVVVRSLWWPGAYNFYSGDRTHHLYVGNGLKHEQESYYPIAPPVMCSERAEVKPWEPSDYKEPEAPVEVKGDDD
jgi:radial spoke head protein 4A